MNLPRHDLGPRPTTMTRAAWLAACVAAVLVLAGCGAAEPAKATPSSTPATVHDAAHGAARGAPDTTPDHAAFGPDGTDHAHVVETTLHAQPRSELSGDSLYHLTSAWTDQHLEDVRLPQFAGGPAVVVMFYGDCTTACPLLVKAAEDIEAALPESLRDITRFVMVSFDTQRDTPAKLLEYAASKGLDRDGWSWLVGTPLQTRQLATMLGVQYRDAGNGTFAHSNVVSVLDAGGVLVARLEGLGVDLGPAVDAISAAAGV